MFCAFASSSHSSPQDIVSVAKQPAQIHKRHESHYTGPAVAYSLWHRPRSAWFGLDQQEYYELRCREKNIHYMDEFQHTSIYNANSQQQSLQDTLYCKERPYNITESDDQLSESTLVTVDRKNFLLTGSSNRKLFLTLWIDSCPFLYSFEMFVFFCQHNLGTSVRLLQSFGFFLECLLH